MIQEKEYLEAKRIVTLYECQQLNIVIKSVCEKCRFKAECPYKEMNTEQDCKCFIDEKNFL
jgi:hypothetical protein